MMDEIKMEPVVDLLGLEPHNTSELKENTTLSEEGNLSHLQVAGIKTECVDHSYDLTSEVKVEDTPEPVSFRMMKCEVEETPQPVTFPMVKSEVDEDSFDLNRLHEEEKVEISSKEDKVLLDSNDSNVRKIRSSECDVIPRNEEELTQCCSNLDSSIACDLSSESNKCKICNEVFVTAQTLKRHFQTHTLKKSLKCDICGKYFLELSSLKTHAILHTGEISIQCDVRAKSSRGSGHLKNDELLQTGEKTLRCVLCGKCFSSPRDLKSHSRIHTGAKSFNCDPCGQSFSNKFDKS
ncbi:zinc finger protein 714-like [Periplaneta americana]|uniref:zinc finger protein 714-like n=1 Tax=Periplaneta americana TaxID=6978 RepID=UPI0037E89057